MDRTTHRAHHRPAGSGILTGAVVCVPAVPAARVMVGRPRRFWAPAKFSASDQESGIDYIQYRIGAGPWKSGAKAVVKRIGRTKVSSRAFDIAGNVSPIKSVVVRVTR